LISVWLPAAVFKGQPPTRLIARSRRDSATSRALQGASREPTWSGLRVERVLDVLRLTYDRAIAQQVAGVSTERRGAWGHTVRVMASWGAARCRWQYRGVRGRAEVERPPRWEKRDSEPSGQRQALDLVCPRSDAGGDGCARGHGRLADKACHIERVSENVAEHGGLGAVGQAEPG